MIISSHFEYIYILLILINRLINCYVHYLINIINGHNNIFISYKI